MVDGKKEPAANIHTDLQKRGLKSECRGRNKRKGGCPACAVSSAVPRIEAKNATKRCDKNMRQF